MTAEKTYEEKTKQRPYIPKHSRAPLKFTDVKDAAFDEEKAWLEAELAGIGNEKEVADKEKEAVDAVIDDDADDGEEEDGNGIECQCCFADYPFVRPLIHHLFFILTLSPQVQNGSMP